MSALTPEATTVGDICSASLKECGAFGVGQTPSGEDITDAWARLQWMLQQWQRERFLIYHLVTLLKTSTGVVSYSVGSGADIDTGPLTARPDKIEMAFLRQLVQSQPNQIDYPVTLLQSMEDYNSIALKGLVAFPMNAFYDPSWPNGTLYFWPVPNANIYALGITVKQALPTKFPTLATAFVLPYEYYAAMMYSLALRLRSKYQIPTYPGDPLPGQVKNALNVIRGASVAIAELRMPANLNRKGLYNIFSDQNY